MSHDVSMDTGRHGWPETIVLEVDGKTLKLTFDDWQPYDPAAYANEEGAYYKSESGRDFFVGVYGRFEEKVEGRWVDRGPHPYGIDDA